jgi:hypothetical protein
MNASIESLSPEWGWGYVLQIKPVEFKVQSLRMQLVLQEGCVAWAFLADVKSGNQLGKSAPLPGRGPVEDWYQFVFGTVEGESFHPHMVTVPSDPEGVGLAVYVSCGVSQALGKPPSQFLFLPDTRVARRLNGYMTIDAASFNGRGERSAGAVTKHVLSELCVVTDGSVNLERGPHDRTAAGGPAAPQAVAFEDPLETLAAEIDRLRSLDGDGGAAVAAALHEKRVRLRRSALDTVEEPFETRLGRMPGVRLLLEVPARGACAFNFRTEEYWVAGIARLSQTWRC